jgi:3-oxoacyl-[acyl-carrier protein] reductase
VQSSDGTLHPRPSTDENQKASKTMQLTHKTVAITGGGRGIGRALAERFGRDGAQVALLDVNAADLETTRSALEAAGVVARSYQVNVAVEEEVVAAMDRIVADFGGLDVMVNNAGILRDALLVKAKEGAVVGKMSLAQWQAVIDVNLTGVFLCGREAAERMIRRGCGGVIINISSISRHGNAGQTNYSAAKAGVAALTVVWAKELARYGIRTGTIAPGGVRTEILASMRPDMLEKLVTPVPLRRLGEPEEIAAAAAFIVSNDFFTGRCIDIDGGFRV